MNKELNKKVFELINSNNLIELKAILLRNKEIVNLATPFGSWLQIAVRNSSDQLVNLLLDQGADIHAKGKISGENVLVDAASQGRLNLVELFLDLGLSMDVSEPDRNPLFRAIQKGHLDIVKYLIKKGIDFRIAYTGKNMKGMDAIAYAKEWGRFDIVDYLEKL